MANANRFLHIPQNSGKAMPDELARGLWGEKKSSHLDARSVCLYREGDDCMGAALVAVLGIRRVLCKLDRLALKLGGTTVGVRGGTTQYSMGNPSRYGILAIMSSLACNGIMLLSHFACICSRENSNRLVHMLSDELSIATAELLC